MIVVHHLNNSRSQRVLWLLEELGLEYRVERYQRDPKTNLAPPELRAIHPLGKSPVMQDGDLILPESGAIIEYLVERYGDGRLKPRTGTPEHVRERVQEHLHATAANYFVANFSFGDMADEQVMRSIGLFTEQIMPSLKRAP